jgi:hypothetical protein
MQYIFYSQSQIIPAGRSAVSNEAAAVYGVNDFISLAEQQGSIRVPFDLMSYI